MSCVSHKAIWYLSNFENGISNIDFDFFYNAQNSDVNITFGKSGQSILAPSLAGHAN